jgi:PAS domain S-box-containing protein
MGKKNKHPAASSGIRRRAVAHLRDLKGKAQRDKEEVMSAAQYKGMVHELQVHQIELEMQNVELQESRDRNDILLGKFTDLYDFAPVGYFSLDHRGVIIESNLTGAAMLGIERTRLIKRDMTHRIVPSSRPDFRGFLERIFAGEGRQSCEIALAKGDATSFWTTFHGVAVIIDGGRVKCCRTTVSDITVVKQADDVRRRLEVMTASNLALQKEITKRQAAEEALRISERHHILLLDQARHMQSQLRILSHQIITAQEDERREISLELHDVISQTLIGIGIRLAGLRREARSDPRGLNRNIAVAQRLVTRSVNIVHNYARELRPAMLESLGLIPTLHSFTEMFTKRTKIPIAMTVVPEVEELDTRKRTVLFRVAQESLNNVARHARAQHIELSIRHLPGGFNMRIKDDGKSFDVARTLRAIGTKRLGIIGMRERLEMVGGRCDIESEAGVGTTITAFMPHDLIGGGGDRSIGV